MTASWQSAWLAEAVKLRTQGSLAPTTKLPKWATLAELVNLPAPPSSSYLLMLRRHFRTMDERRYGIRS